ncbi:hypothetical protein VPNG_03260 [Cytospora leucostoma]|uniref:Uncharacterized protein n=1 Tax=Cytospora leucostoma TaxID=1230097 RepID=A0A423XEJ2_9PEZI|nr:hypothetical protein VPNG_03260 [Cytospora leucostoma]
MASRKPDIRLVASNTHGRDLDHSLDTPRKTLSVGCMKGDSTSAGVEPDSPSSRDTSLSPSSSSSESISDDDETDQDTKARGSATISSFYKSAQWTADGTTVITSSYNNQIGSFVIPSDLLEPREQPLSLRPQGIINLATPTNVVAPAPYFDLLNPYTHHVLVACSDHPIQIFQALPTDNSVYDTPKETPRASPLYSYNLISPQTEAYLPVHSLVWPASHTSFFVGSTNLIAQFDLQRIGEGPKQRVHTIPSKRHISKGSGVGMRGTVSALSMQSENYAPTGLLAAGTWTRWVGLYDFARGGERTATWSIAEAAGSVVVDDPPPGSGQPPVPRRRHNSRGLLPIRGIGGEGINQTAWSPDGRYLLINERQSTGVLVYDVRVTNKLLGALAGRDALTHQRLDLAVYPGSEDTGGFEVWAGTRDGTVKVWQGVGNTEGCQWPSWDFQTEVGDSDDNDDDGEGSVGWPVGSVALHASGSVAATCTGCWSVPDGDGDGDDGMSGPSLSSASSVNDRSVWRPDNKRIEESSLKLWTIGVPAYNAAEYEEEREVSQMDTSQGDAIGMDVSPLEIPGTAAIQKEEPQVTIQHGELDTMHLG